MIFLPVSIFIKKSLQWKITFSMKAYTYVFIAATDNIAISPVFWNYY